MKKNSKKLYEREHTQDLKLVIALNRAANTHNRRAAEIFRMHGLTMMQFAVLEVLYHKGSLNVSEITEKILSTGGNMTVVINNLERDEMVTRKACPNDKRAWLISITAKGKDKIREIFPEYLLSIQSLFGVMPDEEKKALTQSLKLIRG